MATIKNFYAGSHSSQGYYSLYDDVIKDLELVYILKGEPGTGKSTFMRKIGLAMIERDYNLQYIHCSSDTKSIDGILIPALKLGIVESTAPHIIKTMSRGVVVKVIDFSEFQNVDTHAIHKDKIISLTNDIRTSFNAAYETMKEAKSIHHKRKKMYSTFLNVEKANALATDLMATIFEQSYEREKRPNITKRFFGATTSKGTVHFIDNITEDFSRRYIMKGKPGSGKSTIIEKIGCHAITNGLSVEVFPCAFEPNRLDMVMIPALSVAIVDGSSPHHVDPFRLNDVVVNMFNLCVDPRVEEIYKEKLNELQLSYHTKMTLATNFLSKAKYLHVRLKEYCMQAMDFEKVDQKREEVLQEILHETVNRK